MGKLKINNHTQYLTLGLISHADLGLQTTMPILEPPLVLLALAGLVSANFSFNYTQPKACEPITITWQGGTPPYSLLVTPKFSVAMNISIPNDGNSNSFSTTLPIDDTTSFLLTMSDSTGFGSGGTSPLLTPASTGNNSCQATPHPGFTFTIPDSLVQCKYVRLLDPLDPIGFTKPQRIFIHRVQGGNTPRRVRRK